MSHHYVSQLAHVEINTPTPQASLDFCTDVFGLQISHREGQSVWLRAWGEFFHHSLKLTESSAAGLAHAAWRVDRLEDQRSVYPDRPQKQVSRNATVRRLDHCTVYTSELLADRRVMTDVLRFRHMDTTVTPDGEEIFSTVTSGAGNFAWQISQMPEPGTPAPPQFSLAETFGRA